MDRETRGISETRERFLNEESCIKSLTGIIIIKQKRRLAGGVSVSTMSFYLLSIHPGFIAEMLLSGVYWYAAVTLKEPLYVPVAWLASTFNVAPRLNTVVPDTSSVP